MPGKKLYRSVHNRVLAGVCGGLADYFDIDPIIVRLIFIVITIMGIGSGVVLYLIGVFIIPKETELINTDITNRRSSNMSKSNQMLLYAGFIIILIGILISIDRLNVLIFPEYLHLIKFYLKKLFLPGLLIIIGLYLIFEHKKRTEENEDTMDYRTINSQYNKNSTDEKKHYDNKQNTQSKKLYRSLTDKKLTGLCGGIAEYFDIDSTLIRLLVVVIILSSGVFLGIITYFIISILIPTAPPKIDSHFSSTSQETENQSQKNTTTDYTSYN